LGRPLESGIVAHLDDEAFRPAGTLALLARRGVRIHVLATARAQADSRGVLPLYTQVELSAFREKELGFAYAAFDLQPPILLDKQDGLLSEADPDQLYAQILRCERDTPTSNVILQP
jgi:LmbE family N-acetylglucosaminyl deacetylase